MAVSANNPLFDTSRGDFTHINHPHHRHLFDENPFQPTPTNTKPNDKHIRQQMHAPESQETDPSKPQNNHNANKLPPPNKDNSINDLDDILEQQMENESIQRQQQLDTQQQLQHHDHNILLLYLSVLVELIRTIALSTTPNIPLNITKKQIFASIAMMLVSKWGRTKLIHLAHRLGLETTCSRIYAFISQSVPMLNSNNDEININIISSSNKANPRKKLHIKDPSESEKLISSSNTDIRS